MALFIAQYLDRIGQLFFGLPPKPSNKGMMGGILGECFVIIAYFTPVWILHSPAAIQLPMRTESYL